MRARWADPGEGGPHGCVSYDKGPGAQAVVCWSQASHTHFSPASRSVMSSPLGTLEPVMVGVVFT